MRGLGAGEGQGAWAGHSSLTCEQPPLPPLSPLCEIRFLLSQINDLSLLGSTLACGCQDGSVRIYRLHKEASVFALYSLLTLQHTAGVLPLKVIF